VTYFLFGTLLNDCEHDRQSFAIIIIIIIIILLSRQMRRPSGENELILSKIFPIISTIQPDVFLVSADLPVKYTLFPNI
jgi:hypothetical protein